MTKENKKLTGEDRFGLRKVDFTKRIPEKSEIFSKEEAQTYIEGCDYPESADDLMLAWEIKQRHPNLDQMNILDAMCGPGRLGRELLLLGAKSVTFHDGDTTMLEHAISESKQITKPNQHVQGLLSQVANMPIADDSFDLVICHNSTHQLTNTDRLKDTIHEFLRVAKPEGSVIVADYQRDTTQKFHEALERRLEETKPEIVPLLVPTFTAAFSKQEFADAISVQSDAGEWSVSDAKPPAMTRRMKQRVNQDPVKGHLMDFSPISQRAIIKKRRRQ